MDEAWTEVLPDQPTEQVITNFPVHPGDSILCYVGFFDGSSNGQLTQGASFQLINTNPNTSEHTMVQVETLMDLFDAPLSTAEWIVERPGLVVNNQLVGYYDLANYRSQCTYPPGSDYNALHIDATNAGAISPQNTSTLFDFLGQLNYNISMMVGINTLSAVYAYPYSPNPSTMCFGWFAFR